MPTSLGNIAYTMFLYGPESHKLHLEFEVAATKTVYKGELVKLTTGGKITNIGAAENADAIIGIAINGGAAGEVVTVAMRGYAVLKCEANGAITSGPVKSNAFSTTNAHDNIEGFQVVEAATAGSDSVIGWAIEDADDEDEVWVVLKD